MPCLHGILQVALGPTEPARVSVLLPVRSAERFLAEVLSGILPQSSTELEVVVVDDGPTVRTRDILAAVPDERARVLPSERFDRASRCPECRAWGDSGRAGGG
jgi:hypothetical protein